MVKISQNPSRKSWITFTSCWLFLPTYMFFASGFVWIFLPFIIFGVYFLVYLGSKVKDVYCDSNSVSILHRGKYIKLSINEIESVKHFNRGAYKMKFKNKKSLGFYILFYAKTKRLFTADKDFEKLMKQVNT